MRWSFKIARVAGIDIQIHATFFLILIWVAINYWQMFGTINAVLTGIFFILALFLCIVLHEFGHALTARHFGIGTRNITLLPIGGVASMEKMPDEPMEEVKVALAGPAVNFVIAFILWLGIASLYPHLDEQQFTQANVPILLQLFAVNILLAVFNLVPAFPMDGGRVLRALLTIKYGHVKATELAARVGQGFAVVMFFLGLAYNPFLMLIALFIWLGAASESTSEKVKARLRKIKVRDILLNEFHLLSPEDTLGHAVELTLKSTQKDFPVSDSRRSNFFYQLSQNQLAESIKQHGENYQLSRLTLPRIPTATLQDSVSGLLQEMATSGTSMVAVLNQQELVGIIDMDNIMELIKLKPAV